MTATAITAHTTTSPWTPAAEEFDRQSQTLVDAGYPALAGLDEAGFRAMLEPLRRPSRAATSSAPTRIPFAIVVSSALVSADRALPALHWKATTGWTELTADELATFRPIEGVAVPEAPVYLVTDVDTGQETLGVRARDALPAILGEGRTPLTIDEGVSLLALFPGILRERNAFFLPGSHRARRLPRSRTSEERSAVPSARLFPLAPRPPDCLNAG